MTNEDPQNLRRISGRVPFYVWLGVTLAGAVGYGLVYACGGPEVMDRLLAEGPYSDLWFTLYTAGIAWLLAGVLAVLVSWGRIHARNVVPWACFFLTAFLYINILRERPFYGDIPDYMGAAHNLHRGEPLHARYLYPPLWATLLEPLVVLGDRPIYEICWALNVVSLFLFFFLLQGALRQYGFSPNLSAVAVTVFLVANVPLLRTLLYGQINLHVTNLILLALILYPRSSLLSAAALSVAVHLKVSPIVLALPFVLNRDFRWCAWFAACMLAIGGATVALHGVSPYGDFLANMSTLYSANFLQFRETSFDSFWRGWSALAGMHPHLARGLLYACKAALAILTAWVAVRCVKRHTFADETGPRGIVYNSLPVLLVFAMTASPLVWEHHPVFVSLSYLVVLKAIATPGQWTCFGFAYFLEFLVPTFDFFPLSYGRLVSPLLWMGLVWVLSARTAAASDLFPRINGLFRGDPAPAAGSTPTTG